jgi:hypothetical protein
MPGWIALTLILCLAAAMRTHARPHGDTFARKALLYPVVPAEAGIQTDSPSEQAMKELPPAKRALLRSAASGRKPPPAGICDTS